MQDIYQGDPRLVLNEAGSSLVFVGGQPRMDAGLENLALISLFTRQGWSGNVLLTDPDQKIGSDFEVAAEQPITLSALNDIRNAAEKAMDNQAFGTVTATVTNPVNDVLDITILIDPPAANPGQLRLTREGGNWLLQSIDPAYRRI